MPSPDELFVIKRHKMISKAKKLWHKDPDTSKYYTPIQAYSDWDSIYMDQFAYNSTVKYMTEFLRERYEKMLMEQTISFEEIEYYIGCQNFEDLFWDLKDLLVDWRKKYTGSAGRLEFIAKNKQSIHAEVVVKKTDAGIKLLSAFPVPAKQKTLTEITEAWASFYPLTEVERIINDMRYWGAKPTVMSKYENVYKKALRGLWAKIKSYEGETRVELLKRFWEESNESVEMCADGHVGRLINVLVGFDVPIKMISKTDFQDAIAKIANADVPLEVKVSDAKKLMDEYDIPETERQAWLEAF
jgi:hypothetical protein